MPELSEKQIRKIHTKKIPCTNGYGAGIGGEITACFSKNLILTLNCNSTMPTQKELAILASYQEFLISKFSENPEKILQMDFPSDPGYNTVIFIKGPSHDPNGKNGWSYRRMTWEEGPLFSPGFNPDKTIPQLTLIQLLDKIEDNIPKRWQKWKEDHPEIFKTI